MFKESRGIWLLGGLAVALFAVVVTFSFVGGQSDAKSPSTAQPSTTAPAGAARTSVGDTPEVESVSVATELAGLGTTLAPDRYQASTDGTAKVIYRWNSVGAKGEIGGENCRVISSVVGPGGFTHNDTSAACSGQVGAEMTLGTPGMYTITATVIGPGGKSQRSATQTFEVVALRAS